MRPLRRDAQPADHAPPRLSDLVAEPPAWMADALCAEPRFADLDPFKGGGKADAFIAAACSGCLVRPECGAYADGLDLRDGVWGGAWRGPTKKKRAAA